MPYLGGRLFNGQYLDGRCAKVAQIYSARKDMNTRLALPWQQKGRSLPIAHLMKTLACQDRQSHKVISRKSRNSTLWFASVIHLTLLTAEHSRPVLSLAPIYLPISNLCLPSEPVTTEANGANLQTTLSLNTRETRIVGGQQAAASIA